MSLVIYIAVMGVLCSVLIYWIWHYTVWFRWQGKGGKDDALEHWLWFGGLYFFGIIISLIIFSYDQDLRGLSDLVDGIGIHRDYLIGYAVVASLVYGGGLRLYLGEDEETPKD